MESDAIALFSEDSIREFIARGYPRERIFKITNGVSLDVFHPTEAPIDRIEGTPLRVLFSGRLVPLKGLMDLLAVWPQVCTLLAADGRRAELHICGEGPQQAEIEATIAEAGVGETVALRGRIEDMPDELRRSDLFVLPSYAEGNSNALLEAMATGVATVASRVGGTHSLVGPEAESWLFTAGDRDALEQRLLTLLQDDDARESLGHLLLMRAREFLSMEFVAERHCEAYIRLARGQRECVFEASTPIFASIDE
jgi:glycosyltransferase involved in cell wall biosynthesis